MAKNDLVRRIDLQNAVLGSAVGTGLPAHYFATFTVAAVNSSLAEIAGADFVCDGVADEVEIALALASKLNGYSRVLLLSGTFTLGASITFTYPHCTLEGQGSATVLQPAAGLTDFTPLIDMSQNYSRVSDLHIDGLQTIADGDNPLYTIGIFANAVSYLEVSNVQCRNITIGIEFDDCTYCHIGDYTAFVDYASIPNSIGYGIYLNGGEFHSIAGGVIANYATCIETDASDVSIQGFSFQNCGTGVYVYGSDRVAVNGCTVRGFYSLSALYEGANIGILFDTSNHCVAAGNTIQGADNAGIWLDGASDCLVVANAISGCSLTATPISFRGTTPTFITSCGIGVNGGSSRNFITGNTIRKQAAGGTFKALYGIEVLYSGCADNIIVNNDLRDSGDAGEVYDTGTGTQYTPLGLPPTSSVLTIAAGVVTISRQYHQLAPESGLTDDVDTILPVIDGFVLRVRVDDATHAVTLKNGSGNLSLGADVTLSSTSQVQALIGDATLGKWLKAA